MIKRIIVAAAVVGLALAPAMYPSVTQATNNGGTTCSGSALTIPVSSWDTGKKDQEKVLSIKDVENGEYEVVVVSKNQESVHPNTDMIVRSNGSQVEVNDVESEAFKSGKGDGALKVENGKVTLLVRIGEDGVYSGGMDVCLHKAEKPVEKCPISGKEELDKDSDKCVETPEAPKTSETPDSSEEAPQQPADDELAELPQTGLENPVVSAAMLGILAYVSYAAVRSFRG